MTNHQIADKLRHMAIFYEMEDLPFRPQAYEKVADAIDALGSDVAGIFEEQGEKGLRGIPGVGKSIASHIEQLLRRGSFPEYEKMAAKYPVDLDQLVGIEGVGPKTIKTLYRQLNIRNLADLEKAALAGKIRKLPHFGAKSEDNILKGIELRKRSGGRKLLGYVLPLARKMEAELAAVKGVKCAVVAGSVRRQQETIGDIDILVTTSSPERVMEKFAAFPEVAEVLEHGPTKTTVRLSNGMQADVRVIDDASFGSALQYFTGSKEHNILVRKLAIDKGLKLNEYGIWRGRRRVASRSEADVYRAIGLDYIEPELRTASGEVEAAVAGKLPDLLPYGCLRGDLQVQTEWTDGSASIESMAEQARLRGLEYMAVTDHTQALAMVGGLDEKKLARQGKEIDAVNRRLEKAGKKFRVLKGTEVDILKDGSLDLDDAALRQLDVVGASVHSLFRLSRAEQTARIIRAMENPHVDIIFHPTGRVLNQRDPYELDMEEVIKAAKATGTALEIDAFPDRLDLNDVHVRMAVKAGVRLVIDTDAHRPEHLQFLDLGVAVARRGWATKKDVLNTRSLKDLKKWLSAAKNKHR
jgi:DNA polymerase (family 10)